MDPRLLNTIYAEVGGGSPEEVAAVTSVFLNRAKQQGLDKALLGSSAYRLRSPEYLKAATGKLNPYEAKVYQRNQAIIQQLLAKPETIQPYTHFENVKAFGEPSWAKGVKEYKDVGRQRFYTIRPRVQAIKRSKKP